MKKALFTLAFALIMWVLCITSYAADSEYDYIKVGLFYGDNAPKSVNIASDGGFFYGYLDENDFNSLIEIENSSVDISLNENGDFVISAVSDNEQINQSLDAVFYPSGDTFKLNGVSYRGAIILKKNQNGTMTVINHLPLEEYLYSVVGAEMPSSWNAEALKAQAICSRSFAIRSRNKHSSSGFNVCSTSNCQTYKGISTEFTAVTKAVNETRGQVLKYDGEIAETLFFSSDGGHTANVYTVWGSKIPYLCGVSDPYEPETAKLHTWSASLSLEDIKSALLKSNINIGDIVSLNAQIADDQHVEKIDITGTNGSYTLKNQSTYSVFNSYGVYSQKFTIVSYGEKSFSKKLYIKSSSQTGKKPSNLYVLSGDGKKSLISEPKNLIFSSGTVKSISESSDIDGYIFNGGGWGHGIGMSQYGAKGMADQGFNYNEILSYFFPGTYLE